MKSIKKFEEFDWSFFKNKSKNEIPEKAPAVEPERVQRAPEAQREYLDDDFFEKLNERIRNKFDFEHIHKIGKDVIYYLKNFTLRISRDEILYERNDVESSKMNKRRYLDVDKFKIAELFDYMEEKLDMYKKSDDRSDLEFMQKSLSERKRFKK